MKFQDENFSGEIVESDKLRWAVLDDGRKIPATIMLDYFRGVVPESVIHEILRESVKMHRIKERNLRRNVSINGYPLDYIKQERVEFEDEIYSNLLSFAGLEYRDGLPFKIYYSENLTYYRTMKLTKGAKRSPSNLKMDQTIPHGLVVSVGFTRMGTYILTVKYHLPTLSTRYTQL